MKDISAEKSMFVLSALGILSDRIDEVLDNRHSRIINSHYYDHNFLDYDHLKYLNQ